MTWPKYPDSSRLEKILTIHDCGNKCDDLKIYIDAAQACYTDWAELVQNDKNKNPHYWK